MIAKQKPKKVGLKKQGNKQVFEEIIELLTKDSPDQVKNLNREQLLAYVLINLTHKQQADLFVKLRRCNYFVDAKVNKSMPVARIKSILKRQENLSRQAMPDVCRPCMQAIEVLKIKPKRNRS